MILDHLVRKQIVNSIIEIKGTVWALAPRTYVHTYRHFVKTTFWDSENPEDYKKQNISKSIFAGSQYFHYMYTAYD